MPAPDSLELLLWLVPLLALTGVFAGLLAGLLGVGGGIVIVPVCYLLFSAIGIDPAVRMHIAVGTSLATIIPTSLRSWRAHRQRQSWAAEVFMRWLPGLVTGSLLGTLLATQAGFATLTAVFAGVALLVALHMAFGNPDWRIAATQPGPAGSTVLAMITGAIAAMMGIGGGTLGVPLLTLFGLPIHRAVGTAAAFGTLVSVPATIGFVIGGMDVAGRPPFSLGYINLVGVLLIVPASVLAVPWGARLAHAMSQRSLRRAFALFLGVTAARMLRDVYAAWA